MGIITKILILNEILDKFTDKPFYEVVSKNANKLSDVFFENGHPNEKSHRKFAEYIKGYINV